MSGDLRVGVVVTWLRTTAQEDAHEAVILPSGWVRVTWCDGTTTHVSPSALRSITGKGVSYGA